jgi:hypothetical protein
MKVQEPAAESFLHRLWERQLAGKELRTLDGRVVEILSPGTPNRDAGPDYRDATLRMDGRLIHGDIEIHPTAEDWVRHGHHRDPRYNNVVLHIVTCGCSSRARTVRADGAKVPIVDLDQHLPTPAEEMERRQIAAGAPTKDDGGCPLALASESQKLRAISEASSQRLQLKIDRFREERQYADWDHVAYRGIFEALGYSKNQAPARVLADRMPVSDLWHFAQGYPDAEAVAHVQAWLLGASGLLAAAPQDAEPLASEFIRSQSSLWQSYPNRRKTDPLTAVDWRFFRLRPANFPTRRIAAMAVLVVRHRQEGFLGSWSRLLRQAAQLRGRLHQELERTLVVEAWGFWSQRDCFLTGKRYRAGRAPQLLGRDRARDIIINIVLPILVAYAEETGDGILRAAAEEAYATCPKLPENEILRAMGARLWKCPDEAGQSVTTAALQQGLIQLYKYGCRMGDCSFCSNFV